MKEALSAMTPKQEKKSSSSSSSGIRIDGGPSASQSPIITSGISSIALKESGMSFYE